MHLLKKKLLLQVATVKVRRKSECSIEICVYISSMSIQFYEVNAYLEGKAVRHFSALSNFKYFKRKICNQFVRCILII